MKTDLHKINSLAVKFGNRQIGVINRLAGDRHLFSFEESYLDDPQRPTLSLSFKGQAGGIVANVQPTRVRIPPFFSNLLPEGHLRTYLAKRAGITVEREFFLLAALGDDLPGAVTVSPLDADVETNLNHSQIDKDHSDSIPLRFSLAGVQLKFSAIMEATGGLTIPADGMGGSWIIKLPSPRFDAVPENEYVMLALARAIGIQLPLNQLINIKDIQGLPENAAQMHGRALAIARFDRTATGQRIHMEDFAQVFGAFPDDKYAHRSYANIAAVLWAETGEVGTYEFIKRLIFSILIGNGDMHLKNWSLLYPDQRTPILAPAYDLVATLPYITDDNLALTFGGSRRLNEITVDQIRRFADTAGLPASPIARLTLETIERTLDAWQTLEQKEYLPENLITAINQQIVTVTTNTLRNLS